MKKLDLISKLHANKAKVLKTISEMNEADFHEEKDEKWSNAGHIEHLINSIKPLNVINILPKFVLTFKFGKPNRISRSYDELVSKYWEKLATRNPTVNKFGPNINKNYSKEKLTQVFEKQYDKFAKNIENKWDEKSLESYLIPHPLLGKLTVREMIMFTIYHTEHHHKALK
jgi:DinB superfamily